MGVWVARLLLFTRKEAKLAITLRRATKLLVDVSLLKALDASLFGQCHPWEEIEGRNLLCFAFCFVSPLSPLLSALLCAQEERQRSLSLTPKRCPTLKVVSVYFQYVFCFFFFLFFLFDSPCHTELISTSSPFDVPLVFVENPLDTNLSPRSLQNSQEHDNRCNRRMTINSTLEYFPLSHSRSA